MIEANPLPEPESTFVRDIERALPEGAPVLSIAIRLLVARTGVSQTHKLMVAEGKAATELVASANVLRDIHPHHDWNSCAPPSVLIEQYFAKLEERDTCVLRAYRWAQQIHESRVRKLRDVSKLVTRLTQGCNQLRSIVEHEIRHPVEIQWRVIRVIDDLKRALHRGGRFDQDELLRVVEDLCALSKARGEGPSTPSKKLFNPVTSHLTAARPKHVLRGWDSIREALGIEFTKTNSKRQVRERLKRLNDLKGGPIKTSGRKPMADRDELVAWYNSLVEEDCERGEALSESYRQREQLRRESPAHLAESGSHIETRVNGRGQARGT